MLPRLEIYLNSHPKWITARWLCACEQSLPLLAQTLLACPKGPQHVLSSLETVEISIVNDAAIARVHAEFLNLPSATDVITFPYGEIIVSAQTARRFARAHSLSPTCELFRYITHGLVHLHGYLDSTPEQRAELFAIQEPLVEQFCPPSDPDVMDMTR